MKNPKQTADLLLKFYMQAKTRTSSILDAILGHQAHDQSFKREGKDGR